LGQRFRLRARRQARSTLSRWSAARRPPPSSVGRRACPNLHRNRGHRIFVVAAESSRQLAESQLRLLGSSRARRSGSSRGRRRGISRAPWPPRVAPPCLLTQVAHARRARPSPPASRCRSDSHHSLPLLPMGSSSRRSSPPPLRPAQSNR
jgi:hypothetical protein